MKIIHSMSWTRNRIGAAGRKEVWNNRAIPQCGERDYDEVRLEGKPLKHLEMYRTFIW